MNQERDWGDPYYMPLVALMSHPLYPALTYQELRVYKSTQHPAGVIRLDSDHLKERMFVYLTVPQLKTLTGLLQDLTYHLEQQNKKEVKENE